MISYYIGDKPKYDVEMYMGLKDDKYPYVVTKIVVNNPKMYDFYEKNYSDVELIKGFK